MQTETRHTSLPLLVRIKYLTDESTSPSSWNLFGVLILLSAFLLFQTELILAKYILPWFGGTPAVWNTCMMFYQAVLLAGYGYSHWLSSRFAGGKQARIHFGLVALALAVLGATVVFWGSPLMPSARWKYILPGRPVLHIGLLLALAVGIPFFLLSTTGPLMMNWYSRLYPDRSPFRLYAVSNLGSLLGLLGYPFLLEWLLPVRKQALLWTLLFTAFLVLCALQNWMLRRHPRMAQVPERNEATRPSLRSMAMWTSLSACASVMLLATTNQVCQNISSSPFLWVMPLCIYLLSFAICFENSRWYVRPVFYTIYFLAAYVVIHMITWPHGNFDAVTQLSRYFLLLFAVCMVCNGELERLKPSATQLTPFYLSIAFGGALGGVFVVLVAPNLFRGFYEFHLAILGTGVSILGIAMTNIRGSKGTTNRWAPPAWIAAAVLAFSAVSYVAWGFNVSARLGAGNVSQSRNFFGVKKVYDKDGVRYLQNGAITHGAQFLDKAREDRPTAYYTKMTGVGRLFNNYRKLTGKSESTPIRVGVVGLGVGALATYARPGDTMRFYEIDPQIIDLSESSHPKFTFLQRAQGKIENVLGDARLSMETEAARQDFQQFDLLIIDAFASDAIPVHLLTTEAFHLYMAHLKGPDSVIAVHISNRVIDLTPVLRAQSEKWDLAFTNIGTMSVEWFLMSQNHKIIEDPLLHQPFNWGTEKPVLWTDDYSNLLTVLRK